MISITNLDIPDVLLIEPRVFVDERGYFMETWQRDEYASAIPGGLEFIQDNESMSRGGVLRGLHYQKPRPQGKLVRVTHGRAFTVAVDIRRSSATFGRWVGRELSSDNRHQLWVPPGFAHGFLTLDDPTCVVYKATDFFFKSHDRAIRWNDPDLGIEWPLPEQEPIMSARDSVAPLLAEADVFP